MTKDRNFKAAFRTLETKNGNVILLLTFKALNNLCSSYMSDLLKTYKPARSLLSSTRNLLVIPRSKLKSYGDRAFSVSAPKL